MNKLIKAEFYRGTRSGIYFPIFVIIGLFSLAITFILPEELPEKNLFFYLMHYSEMSGMMIAGYTGIIMSVMLGNMYHNRTYYYEIMDGGSIHRIILSKLAVYNTFSLVVLIIPALIAFSIIAAKTGTGEMENPWLAALLGTVIILNITCFNVFITMLVRNMIGGAILLYSYSMGVTMVYLMLSDFISPEKSETVERIFNIFPQVQITKFAQIEYSAEFVASVIGSFIVTFAVFYVLTYISYKKKNFK